MLSLRLSLRRSYRWAGGLLAATVLLAALAGCSSRPKASKAIEPPLSPFAAATITEQAGKAVTGAAAIVTVSRWGQTAIGFLDGQYRQLDALDPMPIDDSLIHHRGGKVAYLVLKGVDPGDNYIRIDDLGTGKSYKIAPSKGFTIFGLALSPDGTQVAYTEVGLRGASSRQAPWRLAIGDLKQGKTRLVASSGTDGLPKQEALIPFAWSVKTGELYLKAQLPYAGGSGRGVWAIRQDGSQARQVLAQAQFAGTPRMSPDGSSLAYLSWDTEIVPKGFGLVPRAGPMPANTLELLDLTTAKSRTLLKAKDAAMGALAWSAEGDEILVTKRAWRENEAFFIDAALVAVSVSTGSERHLAAIPESASVSDIVGCAKGSAIWAESVSSGTRVLAASVFATSTGRWVSAPRAVLAVPDGRIRTIDCVN